MVYKIFALCFNPLPNKPWFLSVCSTSFSKTLWKKEKLLFMSNFSFSQCFYLLENFLPFSSNSKLSSANSFNLEESKICHLGKGKDCTKICYLLTMKCTDIVLWKHPHRYTRTYNHPSISDLVDRLVHCGNTLKQRQ